MTDGKINGALLAAMSNPASPPEHRVIVRYKPDLAITSRPLLGSIRARHFSLLSASAMCVSSEQARLLAADPAVETIWPDLIVHTCLDVSVPHIRAPQVWAAGYAGENVPVAVIDTGIDPSHPDFAGRIAAMEDLTGEGPNDNHGHGTHVAGILAGSGSRYRGVAPRALLYIAKVLHGDGSGYMSEVIAGLEWAVQQHVKVVNLSLGGVGPCDGTDALSTACDAAIDAGLMVCVAAGNYGPTASSVGPPGCARRVLTVGASGNDDSIASFSARGPTADGRVKPDVLLPGVNIASCRAQGTTMGTPVDALYTRASGTSMATPHAAGLAAILLQAFPELSPAQLKQRLMTTAVKLGQDENAQGSGRADAVSAYQGTPSQPGPSPHPSPPGCLVGLASLLSRAHQR